MATTTGTKKQSKKKEPEKTDDQKDNHCICDSKDYTTLMICCDYCAIWYHVECVKVTEIEAKIIKKFACNFCADKDPNCVTVYKKWAKGVVTEKKKGGKSDKKKETISGIKIGGKEKTDGKEAKSVEKRVEQEQSVTITPQQKHQLELQETNPNLRCKKCIGCFREKNCGKCLTCVQNDGRCCMDRICVQVEELLKQQKREKNGEEEEEENAGSRETGQKKGKKGRKPKAKKEEMRGKKQRQNEEAQRKHTTDESTINAQLRKDYENYVKRQKRNGNIDHTEDYDDMQCRGPGCTISARTGSKYCSQSCGIALAKLRLRLILPQRFNAYFGDAPNSQTQNNEQIQRIQEQMADINIKLDELEQWKNNMHQFIVVLKSNKPIDVEKKPSDDENMLIGCPVCHSEFQMREVCKHVQTCFVRSERQTTYGTDYQIPNNQYNLYCEAFNKIDGTYCKRLRYACAEHYKDDFGLEICGCPLNWYEGSSLEFREMFSSQEGASFGNKGFCREKQKSCRDHKNWSQTALSLIDNERLNLLNKFDELCEQRRYLQLKLLQRGDILSLVCNSTESF